MGHESNIQTKSSSDEKQEHRLIQLEGIAGDLYSDIPLKAGPPGSYHFTQSFIQSGSEVLQGQNLHNLSGKLAPVLDSAHSKKMLPYVPAEHCLLQLTPGVSYPHNLILLSLHQAWLLEPFINSWKVSERILVRG